MLFTALQQDGLRHHAYLIEGEPKETYKAVAQFLEQECSFPTRGNPDFWYGEFSHFGIEDARKLKQQQADRPVQHEYRVFVIAAGRLLREAQNALLKVFEEPAHSTRLILLVPRHAGVLPTLRSRAVVFSVAVNGGYGSAESFLRADYGKRLKLIQPVLSEKDINAALNLVNETEALLAQNAGDNVVRMESFQSAFEAIQTTRRYLSGSRPMLKPLLEYFAISIPVVEIQK